MAGYQGCACFWLEPTGNVRLSLRRFSFGVRDGAEDDRLDRRACPAKPKRETYQDGCNASIELDREIPLRMNEEPDGYSTMADVPDEERPPRNDPRWPTVCAACGQPFPETDQWQVNQSEVYTRGDTGELVAFRGYGDRSMAGALYDAWWLRDYQVKCSDGSIRGHVGPDGIALIAVCPNGAAWTVDGPARDDGRAQPGGWTRTGDPRQPETLTVSPSIVAGDYHGFLQAGRFTDG